MDHRGRVYGTPSSLGGATNVVIGNGAKFLAYDGTTNGTPYALTPTFRSAGWAAKNITITGAIRVSGVNATFSGNVTLTGNAGLYTQSATANSTLRNVTALHDGGSGYGLAINAYSNAITLSGG